MSYEIRRFNAAFTMALQQSLCCAESTTFLVLTPISLKLILILSSYLALPKGLYPMGLPVKILKELLPSSILAT